MNFTKQMERIEKAHNLIRLERTGAPDVFAAKLGISLNQLHHDLEFFKSLCAEVKYSIKNKTFYYAGEVNLDFMAV